MNETLSGTFFCNKCGTLNTVGAQFCSHCGASTSPTPSVAPTAGSSPPNPGSPYSPLATPYQAVAPVAGVGYGGFWIRVVAYIIDGIILGIVNAVIDAILQVNPQNPQSATYGVALTLEILLSVAYFAGLWTYMGATLGQRIFKLRVVDANTGQPISLGKALLRWVGLIISFLVCTIGVIWVAFDSRKQGWADKIAGTLVLQG